MKNLYFGLKGSVALCVCIIFSILLVGCCAWCTKQDTTEEAMFIKASALTKLSTAVEVTINIEEPDKSVSDQEILRISTEDDPSLLEPFKNNVIKINREFGHAVILVCSEDGKQGLLEDAGCTAKMDEYLWNKVNACAFTILSSSVCTN
jgi:hypothetical protein